MNGKIDKAGLYKTVPTFGNYLKNKYGIKIAKIPVALSGFTCPNIDGTVARGGCTFCLNESFSPNYHKNSKKFFLGLDSKDNPILNLQISQLLEQIRKMKRILGAKHGYKKFIVYFQAFTNTYAPLDTLKVLYETALNQNDIIGLSIGTRSDSITYESMKYISSLSKEHEIWIEYGVQSVFDNTLRTINRGHSVNSVESMIKKTKELGINVCAHLIFGLPGENRDMMLHSAKTIYGWGIDSVKYHPLYVVEKTALANEYKSGKYAPISLESYIEILAEALMLKPERITVQRISAGIDNGTILAPDWCGYPKNKIIETIRRELFKKGLII